MKSDAAWEAAVRRAARPYQPYENKRRLAWLHFVEFDNDGCWIWHGSTTNGRPVFQIKGWGRREAVAAFMYLWMNQDKRIHTSRACGKLLCVRPACRMKNPGGWTRRAVDWAPILAEYDTGVSGTMLARRHHVDYARLKRALALSGRVCRVKPIFDWELGRKLYLNGTTLDKIAETLGCSRTAVVQRRRTRGWQR